MTDDDPKLTPEQQALYDRRVRCAIAAIRASCVERGEHPMHGRHAISALLCDLRAFCEDAGENYDLCDRMGLERFEQEGRAGHD